MRLLIYPKKKIQCLYSLQNIKISSREAPLCRINAYVLQPWAHIGKDLALTMDRKVL